ncbi:hypothetical protein [Pseudogemmobacter bohemicus]|uniref:hypothetical protein n=1 Tax=Pseudogemmobacter bohemicus TaxID=2250708 RepID=UPI000DD4411D|nr:hypothetical protein [Pseudogemmobacter bohemicus]
MSARGQSGALSRAGRERLAVLLATLAMAAVLALTVTPREALGFLSASPAHAFGYAPAFGSGSLSETPPGR